jgi:hypothetical protein
MTGGQLAGVVGASCLLWMIVFGVIAAISAVLG